VFIGLAGDAARNLRRSSSEVSVIAVRFQLNLEFANRVLVKPTNIKLRKSPFNGSLVITRGQTDRHGEDNRRIFSLRALF
jgi:hypothetical protein